MSKLLITVAIGIAAGLIDIAPMAWRRADPTLLASVFMHWFVTTIFISYAIMPMHPAMKGALIGGLSTLPILITYAQSHPERLVPVFAIALALGAAIGFLTDRFAS